MFSEVLTSKRRICRPLMKNAAFDTEHFAVRHFAKERFQNQFTHIQMKKGAPFMSKMSLIMNRMHAMGFDDYFIWKRLPIEAQDWGEQLD